MSCAPALAADAFEPPPVLAASAETAGPLDVPPGVVLLVNAVDPPPHAARVRLMAAKVVYVVLIRIAYASNQVSVARVLLEKVWIVQVSEARQSESCEGTFRLSIASAPTAV